MNNRTSGILFCFILIVAIILRTALAWVNLDANDDHHKAVQLMIGSSSLTSYNDCGQCYHPKLFHLTAAAIQEGLHLNDYKQQMRSGQLLNTAAGIGLLLLIWTWLQSTTWDHRIKLSVFALMAINPKLVAINAQYTNDAFVLFFSALAILGTMRFILTKNRSSSVVIIVGCVGAALSKGSGIPLTFAITSLLGIEFAIRRDSRTLRTMVATVLLFILIVPYGGNYIQNFKDSEQVLGLNGEYSPPPHFYKKSYIDRPGVVSVVHSYLTFRIIDLIRNPFIVNDHEGYAVNRTSVWSQVYARSISARFDQWPKSWMSTEPGILRTTRVLLIAGLLPFMVLLLGLVQASLRSVQGIRQREFNGEWFIGLLHLLIIGAMIAMLMKLTWQHRDFCTMKAIYIWPGLLSFLYVFGIGLEKVFEKSNTALPVVGAMVLLLATSIYEIARLIGFLSRLP